MKLLRKRRSAPARQEAAQPPVAAICTGLTQKGKPCTLEPEAGKDRCVFHPRKAGEGEKK